MTKIVHITRLRNLEYSKAAIKIDTSDTVTKIINEVIGKPISCTHNSHETIMHNHQNKNKHWEGKMD